MTDVVSLKSAKLFLKFLIYILKTNINIREFNAIKKNGRIKKV